MAGNAAWKQVVADVGLGLAAGAVGVAAMTTAQRIEMKLTGRSGSTVPAKAAEEVFAVDPQGQQDEQALSQAMHWSYGINLGILRMLLSRGGRLKEPQASVLFFGLAWTGGMTLLTGLKLAPPPTQWGKKSILMDAGHHAVYAAATSLACDGLHRVTH